MTDNIPLLFVPGVFCDVPLWEHQFRHLAYVSAMEIAETTRNNSIAAIVDRALGTAPPCFALAGLSMGVCGIRILAVAAREDQPAGAARHLGARRQRCREGPPQGIYRATRAGEV